MLSSSLSANDNRVDGLRPDAPDLAPPGEYKVGVLVRNRNAGINNIPNSVNLPFYIESTFLINTFLGLNTSPILLIPPVDFLAAVGVKFTHNPGAIDIDGDSLAYRLVVCKENKATDVNGYTFPNDPIFGGQKEDGSGAATLTLDPITGDLCWDAPGKVGEYNVAFIVEEWRDGVLIGQVNRDMQILVKDNPNRPPVISPLDTCVIATFMLEDTVISTDPNQDFVSLEAFSELFDPPGLRDLPKRYAEFELLNVQPPNGEEKAFFNWETVCEDVRVQPYKVTYRSVDSPDPLDNKLTTFETWLIRVIGPAPDTLISEVDAIEGSIKLSWNSYACPNASKMTVWRREGSFNFMPDSCETGLPEGSYEQIGEVDINQTEFLDDNNGEGLEKGKTYCYRIYAVFPLPGGGESIVSMEVCETIPSLAPLLINVNVDFTKTDDGEIFVRWVKPLQTDTVEFPRPYTYKLFRSETLRGTTNYTEIPQVFEENDIKITSQGLDEIGVDISTMSNEEVEAAKLDVLYKYFLVFKLKEWLPTGVSLNSILQRQDAIYIALSAFEEGFENTFNRYNEVPSQGCNTDIGDVSVENKPYMFTAIKLGLMHGNGTRVFPNDTLKRQDMAKVLVRLLHVYTQAEQEANNPAFIYERFRSKCNSVPLSNNNPNGCIISEGCNSNNSNEIDKVFSYLIGCNDNAGGRVEEENFVVRWYTTYGNIELIDTYTVRYTSPQNVFSDLLDELICEVENANGKVEIQRVYIPLAPTGNSSNFIPTLDASDYGNLQDAIDAARDLNVDFVVVLVDEGVYNETITLYDGVYIKSKSCNPATTIIDGGGEKDVVKISGNKQCGIIGFTLRNSKRNGQAAGVKISGSSNVLIKNCLITQNNNGIFLAGNSTLCFVSSNIVNNEADGLRMNGNVTLKMNGSIIANNAEKDILKNGNSGNLELNDNFIFGNGENVYATSSTSLNANGFSDSVGAGNSDCEIEGECVTLPEPSEPVEPIAPPLNISVNVEPSGETQTNGQEKGKARLSWSTSGRVTGISHYEIFTENGIKIGQTTDNFFDMLVEPNIEYRLKIRGVSDDGRVSAFSNVVSVIYKVDEVLSTDDLVNNDLVKIFPNPNQGSFFITNNELPIHTLEIRNLLGQVVWKQTFDYLQKGKFEVSTKNLPNGLYFVIGTGKDNKYFHKKFIKN